MDAGDDLLGSGSGCFNINQVAWTVVSLVSKNWRSHLLLNSARTRRLLFSYSSLAHM